MGEEEGQTKTEDTKKDAESIEEKDEKEDNVDEEDEGEEEEEEDEDDVEEGDDDDNDIGAPESDEVCTVLISYFIVIHLSFLIKTIA